MNFQQGLSGLNATSKNLEVIGNNVANANTYGTKASRAEFADMYASTINNIGTGNVGIGVQVAAVSQQFTQGSLSATDNPLDMAINGAGFFQVKDTAGNQLYTRNGQFKLDKEGFIVNNSGQKLLGYPANADGVVVPGAAGALQLPTAGIAPMATDEVKMEMNLDSRGVLTDPTAVANKAAADAVTAQAAADAAVVTTQAAYDTAQANADAAPADTRLQSLATAALAARDRAVTVAAQAATTVTTTADAAAAAPLAAQIDFEDPASYNKATSMTAYDVKGQPVAMTYYFQKSAPDTWNIYATANGTSINVDASGRPVPVTQLQFPTSGAAPISPAAPVVFDVPGTTAADGSTTEPITGVSFDFTQATQYGATFSVTDLTQNGYAPGEMSSLNVESNGIITARYSNGLTKSAGQIEVANFRNPQGLQAVGGNAWASTFASGSATVGTPDSGNFGQLQSGSLEDSNVDLTAELVNMITAQRVYQANAQTIKTQDSVLQTLVNLK
ncbi:protein of unknown function DUF1078 domain protein [Leptothrix cholodnii SP-6]|uniref:Flagellar hook protein FlgE n=1 Tax=Leptothrix cholodnii (strain ATCC 51168 / LMG 8142 / SP-6) TaxID=395495 RepID=B1XWJ5_LEPCP|nr:flagellar hook protein FlgE [Leptothrix cholodnii]ACB34996.1 protein of unknown function DUF1078 domain protein [Leptothrix cholodnii SP-6]